MIILKATTETLQITTSTAAGLDYSISYADIGATTFAPSSNEGKISSATTTSALSAPAASTQRQVKFIIIANRDASLSSIVTVQKLISSTAYNLTPPITLLPGETLQYADRKGWVYYSATGAVKGNQAASGSTYQVQFNNNGALQGDPNFTWNWTTPTLAMANNPTVALNSWNTDPTSINAPNITSIGTPASKTTGTTLAVPVPAGVAVGSLVIMVVGTEYQTSTLATTAAVTSPGFTVAQVNAFTPYANFSEASFLLYKYATAADTGTYTITFNMVAGVDQDEMAAIAAIVSGGPTSGNPFVDTFRTGTTSVGTSVTVSSFTPTANNSLLIASVWNDDQYTNGFPSGWANNASTSAMPGISLATLRQGVAAATGSLTWTSPASTDFAILIGTIRAPSSSTYTLPANTGSIYARTTSGHPTLSVVEASLSPMSIQSAVYQHNFALWTTGTAAGTWMGTLAATVGGTAATVTPTTTNAYTVMRRSTFSSVVTTTNQKLGIASDAMFFTGNIAGQGGFFFSCRFGFDSIKTGMRAFVGLAPAITITAADPSTSLNILGFGFDLADTAFTFMHNNGSGTATKDAIAGQGTLATNNSGYDAYMWSAPNSTTVYYRLDRTDTGATLIDSSTTTKLPVAGTLLVATAQMSNGTANTAVNSAVIGINRLYVETIR
jgi:hypothetical protein